jgi:thermitase
MLEDLSVNRIPTFPLLAGTLSVLALVGCGLPDTGLTGLHSQGPAVSHVYSVGGQPQIIVKRRPGNGGETIVAHNSSGGPVHIRALHGDPVTGVEVLAVTDGNVQAALQALSGDPTVEYAEPNYRLTIPEQDEPAALKARTDINFPGEYGPQITHAVDVQSRTDGNGQVIAIVDTGIDLTHPDLAPKLVPGTNTVAPGRSAADDQGHGTNCAGIAASLKDAAGGIVGMAPGAKLMPVKVLSADGGGSDASVAEGIRWAADHGATIISLSLGGPTPSRTGADAVAYALSKGITVVAAMGNNGSGNKSYPAAYPGVIAVGATDINDQVASFSQYGSWISVSAPGYSILSTFPTYHVTSMDAYAKDKDFWEEHGMRATPKYAYITGTSQATPHVSGLAALVRAANPGLTPDQVKAKIEGAATHTSGMLGGAFDVHYGHGRIDALKAL